MKRGTKTFLLITVLILALLFGVGQFFAPSPIVAPAGNASGTAGAGGAPPATEVIAYVPPAPASSTPVVDGSCWTSSIAAPFRTDAWRCSVGNSIEDPCFEIPGSQNLLCNMNPAAPDSTSSFVLSLTKPLPATGTIQGGIPGNWAWLVELADGTLCSPFTGTLPIGQGGVAASYGCAPSAPGAEGLYIFDINSSSSEWTADVGTFAPNATSGLPAVENEQTVPISTVWQ